MQLQPHPLSLHYGQEKPENGIKLDSISHGFVGMNECVVQASCVYKGASKWASCVSKLVGDNDTRERVSIHENHLALSTPISRSFFP